MSLIFIFDQLPTPRSNDNPCTVTRPSDDSSVGQQDTPPVYLIDPSTGAVLDPSGPVVVQNCSRRPFLCLVHDASPGTFDISWMLGSEEVTGSTAAESKSGGGLVNVSSLYFVKHRADEPGGINLTCLATSSGGLLLNATVEITFCRGQYKKSHV